MLGRAIAGEANANLIVASGSDFSAKYYGEGIQRVNDLFELARKHAPVIVFIDEIDGLGKREAGGGGGGGVGEQNRVINAFLTKMDGFTPLEGVVIIGATNYPERVDEALRRDGRLDRVCHTHLPTIAERKKLFEFYRKRVKWVEDDDMTPFARLSSGMSPAEIQGTVNLAATYAAVEKAPGVNTAYLLRALDDKRMGAPTLNFSTNETDRKRTAYHEAGHAVVAKVRSVGKVEKITIAPRGQARGASQVTQESDVMPQTKSELSAYIEMLLGGRAVELMVFGEQSAGASDDLGRASKLAVDMVAHYGFSDVIGPFSVAHLSESMAAGIRTKMLEEARQLVANLHQSCFAIVSEYRDVVEKLSAALLDRETVEITEIDEIFASHDTAREPVESVEPLAEAA
jgi:cell division protease FtsH